MKRSSLKPSTKPLRRRKPLSKVSAKRKDWLREYRAKKRETKTHECAKCHHIVWVPSNLEPHHPFGQIGKRILLFVWLCHLCHTWIHDHGKKARELGMIMPEFDGRKSSPETPNFFNLPLP